MPACLPTQARHNHRLLRARLAGIRVVGLSFGLPVGSPGLSLLPTRHVRNPITWVAPGGTACTPRRETPRY